MGIGSYSAAGVDIDKGDRFVDFIRSLPSSAVSKSIGGFSGGMALDLSGWKEPVLLATTDGVGTKLLVAQALKRFDTVGIDLVAMCVNDLIVCGAKPLLFLDYIATGRIEEPVLQALMRGIVAGCEQAECTLSGGETAEMPDLYRGEDFDLAGFAVGLVEKSAMLPKLDAIEEGDALLGLPSVGVHSNGLSLARKAIPAGAEGGRLWEELLRPTKIYVREMRELLATGLVLAAAHITGSGLEGNLPRVIPEGLKPRFTRGWEVPGIFTEIQRRGSISEEEMRRVFNMGLGIVLVAKRREKERLMAAATSKGIAIKEIGELARG